MPEQQGRYGPWPEGLGNAVVDSMTAAMAAADAQSEAIVFLEALKLAGWVAIPDEPDHFVTFDDNGWFVEHSVACRLARTLGTCDYNDAIRKVADDGPPSEMGRFRITDIDSEGLPSLERV